MSMLFSLLMKADAGQAKAELRSLSGEVAKGKTEVTALGNAAAAADGKLDGLASASAGAAAANDRLAQTQTRVQTSTNAAAGSMGNLVAQFNDIGMMIAAGQNPLQLAIQQGTQITQVIGPMGAAGAVSSLGGAFLSALSPINLVTIGAIAFGTWAIQSFMGGADAARSFAEEIDDARAAVDDLRSISSVTTAEMRDDFGAVNADIVEMQAALGRIATIKAFQTQRAALMSLKAESEGSWWAAFTEDRFTQGGQIADLLGTDWLIRGQMRATKEVGNFRNELAKLETAQGPRAQLEVFGELQRQMLAATGGIDQMTLRQMAFYEALVVSEQQVRQLLQAQMESAAAAENAARAVGADNGRMGGPMAWDLAAPTSNVSADLPAAQELLATLQEEASIRELINQHGRDSEIVALARLEAERAAFVEMANGMDVADGVKQELISAWDAANGLASARIAAAISSALGPASALNGLLQSAAGWWANIQSNMAIARFNRDSLAGSQVYSGRGGDPRDFMSGGSKSYDENFKPFVYDGPALDRFNNPVSTGSGRGSSAGGAASAREERNAVAELITKLREEQEVLQTTDPIKRELLKYRKQMAEATVAERAEVEALIRTEQQLKAVQAAREYASDAVGDFLDQVIAKGGKASDVLRNLASQFLSMATRSVLSGSGWFADLLGISGGLFGGGKVQTKADGGMIFGAGGPRADKVPVWASAGEFMVNARATAKYRPVLERINSGAGLPGFANGGMIGGGRMGSTGLGASSAPPSIIINIKGAMGNEEIRKMTAEGVQAGLKHYDTHVLPSRVDRIQRAPRDR